MSVFIYRMKVQDVQGLNLNHCSGMYKVCSINPGLCFPLCSSITKIQLSEDKRKELESDAEIIHLLAAAVSPKIIKRRVRIIGNSCYAIPNLKVTSFLLL